MVHVKSIKLKIPKRNVKTFVRSYKPVVLPRRIFIKDGFSVSRLCVLLPKSVLWVFGSIVTLLALAFIGSILYITLSPKPAFYNESCQKTNCAPNYGLVCLNNTCMCQSTQYYDGECVNKKDFGYVCSSNNQCKLDLICDINTSLCVCNASKVWSGSQCVDQMKSTINENCSATSDCIDTQQLTCINGTCSCTQYWDSTNKMCTAVPLLGYGQSTCTNSSDCQQGKSLFCNKNGTTCNCPTSSAIGMCDCYRVQGNESYWDGAKCTPALSHGSSCTSASTSYMCQTLTQGTQCNSTGTVFSCQCSNFNYFNVTQNKCINQTTYGGVCSTSVECRSDRFLQCISGVCTCNSTYPLWSSTSTKCTTYKTYAATCSSGECDPGLSLVCNTATNNCSCPTNLGVGQCDCVRVAGNESYWSGSSCTSALTKGNSCSNSYMCKTLTEGTVCNDTGSGFKCQCQFAQYFNTTQAKCMAQQSNLGVCSSTIACRVDLGLICVGGICQCNSTFQFWSSTLSKCMNYKTYSDTCSTGECNPMSSLICNTASNNCNCPTNLGVGKCDCVRAAGNESYWNGSSCVAAGAYTSSCNSGNDFECQTLTELTSCVLGKCGCGSQGGWKSTTNKCTSCASNWMYFEPYCYRIGKSTTNGAKSATISSMLSSCEQSLLPSAVQSTLRFAQTQNATVLAWFASFSKDLWLDLRRSSSTLYNSNDGLWSISSTDPLWCAGGDENCMGLSGSGNCYVDDNCGHNLIPACQYTP